MKILGWFISLLILGMLIFAASMGIYYAFGPTAQTMFTFLSIPIGFLWGMGTYRVIEG